LQVLVPICASLKRSAAGSQKRSIQKKKYMLLPLFVWLGLHTHNQQKQAMTDEQIRQYEAETHRMEVEAKYHIHPSPTPWLRK
jgi:hypothetical protein